MYRFDRRLALACLLLGMASTALAQPASAPAGAPSVRVAELERLPGAQRERILAHQRRLQAMSAQQRQAFRQRLEQWNALSPRERRQQRERWQAWQALPAAEQARIVAARQAFDGLPVTDQLAVRKRYAGLDETDKHGWLLGPALGVDWRMLEPLLMQVPVMQREPLLAALRAMSPQQRRDLGVLAQRTPPQARNRLREQLLATPPAQRGAWLVRQLDR